MPQGAAFCPECGAPQLRVPGPEAREAAHETAAGEKPVRHTGDIAWPAAVQSAALYAVPAGLLLSFLPFPQIDMVWVVLGAVWTVRRYRRREPKAPILTPQLGGRIGLVLGLFAALVTTAVQVLGLISARFALHQGGTLDAQFRNEMQAIETRAVAMHPSTADQLAQVQTFLHSPEAQGAYLLFSVAASVAWTLFFAWLSGRLTVRYGLRRQNAQ